MSGAMDVPDTTESADVRASRDPVRATDAPDNSTAENVRACEPMSGHIDECPGHVGQMSGASDALTEVTSNPYNHRADLKIEKDEVLALVDGIDWTRVDRAEAIREKWEHREIDDEAGAAS